MPAALEGFRYLTVVLIVGDLDSDASLSRKVGVVPCYTLDVLMGTRQEFIVLPMVPDKTLARRDLILGPRMWHDPQSMASLRCDMGFSPSTSPVTINEAPFWFMYSRPFSNMRIRQSKQGFTFFP